MISSDPEDCRTILEHKEHKKDLQGYLRNLRMARRKVIAQLTSRPGRQVAVLVGAILTGANSGASRVRGLRLRLVAKFHQKAVCPAPRQGLQPIKFWDKVARFLVLTIGIVPYFMVHCA